MKDLGPVIIVATRSDNRYHRNVLFTTGGFMRAVLSLLNVIILSTCQSFLELSECVGLMNRR